MPVLAVGMTYLSPIPNEIERHYFYWALHSCTIDSTINRDLEKQINEDLLILIIKLTILTTMLWSLCH